MREPLRNRGRPRIPVLPPSIRAASNHRQCPDRGRSTSPDARSFERRPKLRLHRANGQGQDSSGYPMASLPRLAIYALVLPFTSACTLIVDIDRSRIPATGSADASFQDGGAGGATGTGGNGGNAGKDA